ncbi:MAG: DUF2089 domain-containing protein [Anaerolineales bacterium]|nr:DUF2089 domain-containing protein [Anaerolineales bacterium]
MHPVISQCPVCHDDLIVARLYCPNCATAIEGRFNLGRFAQLDQQKLDFVETFIRCEGKLTRVQDELGISYPTVRSRLEDVIRALGYEVEKPESSPLPVSDEERRAILADLAAGRITSEEAMRLLQGKSADTEQEQ